MQHQGILNLIRESLIKGIQEGRLVPPAISGCCSKVDYIIDDGTRALGESQQRVCGFGYRVHRIEDMSQFFSEFLKREAAFRLTSPL